MIGISIAFRLPKEGLKVTLIKPNELVMSASYGNTRTIADYVTIPVGTLSVFKNLPGLFFNHDSPLSVRYRTLPSLMPWLIEFAYQSLPPKAKTNARKIDVLLKNANEL